MVQRKTCLFDTDLNKCQMLIIFIDLLFTEKENCDAKNTIQTNFESYQNHKIYQNNHSIIFSSDIKR